MAEKRMRTVSEVAKELNMSPQAINKKINNQLQTKLQGVVEKDSRGKWLISEKAFKIIATSCNQVAGQVAGELQPDLQLISVLTEQLKTKDEQISELLKQNASLIDKLENMQVLMKLKSEKVEQIEGDIQEVKSQSLWSRIFKNS